MNCHFNNEINKCTEIYLEQKCQHLPPDSQLFRTKAGRMLETKDVYPIIRRFVAKCLGILPKEVLFTPGNWSRACSTAFYDTMDPKIMKDGAKQMTHTLATSIKDYQLMVGKK